MKQGFPCRRYSLPELLDRLNLEYDIESMHMDCPFCGGKRKIHLTESTKAANDYVWRCPKCEYSGGVLQFYSFYVRNEVPPSDKAGLKKISYDLSVFMEGETASWKNSAAKIGKQIRKRETIPLASDSHLSQVYTAMAALPALQLLPEHRSMLRQRGLADKVIDQNAYRSIPHNFQCSKEIIDLYYNAGGETLRKGSKALRYISPQHIQFGLMIASQLISQGLDLKGVPGFFRFGVNWCFWVVPGILIPTRNIIGEIVIWQVRKDKTRSPHDAKYITVSKQDLPGHVTVPVSRCHFPLQNRPLGSGAAATITEGPLKADVAVNLSPDGAFYFAIPGISTTKSAFSYADQFKANGITTIYNALDMDKLTNPNVRRGSDNINTAFINKGFAVKTLYWGKEYASAKLTLLKQLARNNGIALQFAETNDVFLNLDSAIQQLSQHSIPYVFPSIQSPDRLYYWENATKGIDDYLFSTRRK